MSLDLQTLVGKPIDHFCQNGFTASNINHCAHFVSHALELSFSYHCQEHTAGSAQGANIRVHEVFAQCPLVGAWSDADLTQMQLIFVTRATHVDLGRKEMVNHPQKHIGIFKDGMVYHYSNSRDKVVKQPVDDFFDTFEAIYVGTQGLFFGLIPGSDLDLRVDLESPGAVAGKPFVVTQQDNHYIAAAATEPAFYLGHPVRYHGRRGLYHPPGRYHGPVYRAADYHDRYDHWAYVVEAIGHCEGQNHFNLINTYDRAAFTFGFVQFAAHTPNDNLILLFRELLRLPDAKDYFPELELRNEQVCRINENGSITHLEQVQAGELGGFMHYLNPHSEQVDDQELLHAARLTHWVQNSSDAQAAQVKAAIAITSRKVMERYHRWYDLEGRSDLLVTIICDIHHQGRASRATVEEALAQPQPVQALLRVNHSQWRDRNERLEQITQRMVADGWLGKKVYDPANNVFITPPSMDSLVVDVAALPPLPPNPLPVSPPTPPQALRLP